MFRLLDGEPATKDILDGVDTTWTRVPGGAPIGQAVDEIIVQFSPQNTAASVPALLALRSQLTALAHDPVVDEKRRLLDRILQACLGLSVATEVSQAEVVPGEAMTLRHTAVLLSQVPVRWVGVRYPGAARPAGDSIELHPGEPAVRTAIEILPAGTPLSQPYWLRAEPSAGVFRVAETELIGRPENPPAFPIEQVFEVAGQTLVIPDEPVEILDDATHGKTPRRVEVIAPAALKFVQDVRLFAPGATRPVEVEVTAFRPGVAGELRLTAPAGWTVAPAGQAFRIATVGGQAKLRFMVTAPPHPATASLALSAEIGGVTYGSQRVEIHYSHLAPCSCSPPPAAKP